MQIIPFLGIRSPEEVWRFAMDLHICNAISVAIALYLYAPRRRTAWPLAIAAAAIALQSLAFATIGVSAEWSAIVRSLATIPESAVIVGGLLIASTAVYLGWTGGKRRAPPVRREEPVEAALTA